MDFPRRELQAQAELSVSGQFLLSPPPQNNSRRFSCRACGGRDFTVDTRKGIEIRISSLKPWQAVSIGDFAGTHNVYTCAHCAHEVAEAHERVRLSLMGQMMFAARDLAEIQFRRPCGKSFELQCAECRRVQHDDKKLDHQLWCRTGHVLRLLEALMQVGEKDFGSESRREGTTAPVAKMGGVQ